MNRLALKLRFFRSKEALLVLVWTAFPFAILANPNLEYIPYVVLAMLWFPVAGCLSDVCIKRYVFIRYSLWIVWAFVMIFNILLIFQQYLWKSQTVEYLELVVSILTLFGMAGVWTNIFQFGVDQLTDASSSDITSYISWYVWIFCVFSSFVPLFQNCSCKEYDKSITYFFLPFLGSIALITDFLFNENLVKEPPTQNTFKLVYQVLKFAAKNKYPRLRSAFTYWEDKPYSRIDLGKAKYGGPFTTEQVEDVKTFFRLLAIIAVSTPYFGVVYILYSSFRDFGEFRRIKDDIICNDFGLPDYLLYCLQLNFFKYSTFIIMAFLIPLLELLLYPLLMQCHHITRLKIKHKLLFGTLLLVIYEVCMLTFEIVNVSLNSHYVNSTCYLFEDGVVNTIVNYKWLIFIQPILGTAVYILLCSYLELLCAQSPYSMKGLLAGTFYCVGFIAVSVSTGLIQVFGSLIKMFSGKCRLWWYTALLGLTTVLMCLQFISVKCYKLRKRDETLRNDQMFAVDYFNKYLSSRPRQMGKK